jgi:hypothetical protein
MVLYTYILLYMRYFLGLIMVGIGVLLIIKTEWFVQNFGSNAWAEEHLGTSGGTRLMYKLIGIVFIFFWFFGNYQFIKRFFAWHGWSNLY